MTATVVAGKHRWQEARVRSVKTAFVHRRRARFAHTAASKKRRQASGMRAEGKDGCAPVLHASPHRRSSVLLSSGCTAAAAVATKGVRRNTASGDTGDALCQVQLLGQVLGQTKQME